AEANVVTGEKHLAVQARILDYSDPALLTAVTASSALLNPVLPFFAQGGDFQPQRTGTIHQQSLPITRQRFYSHRRSGSVEYRSGRRVWFDCVQNRCPDPGDGSHCR